MSRPQGEDIRGALLTLGLSTWEVWIAYVSIGGSLSPAAVEMFLRDEGRLEDHDFDLVVQALNEQFMDRGGDHPIAYSSELPAAALDQP